MVQPYISASTNARPNLSCHITPKQAWKLAPLIAGQPLYRVGRWRGQRFGYPRPDNPPRITDALPDAPAAVMVHGTDGSVSTLCLDLDTSKAAKHVVDSDAAGLGSLLAECGLRFVQDFSPSGGIHLYVPLGQRMDGAAARELVEAMTLRAPSLDPGPHQNLGDGCIRVPGSPHKSGGHQVLVTPLSTAYDVLRHRNPAAAVEALRRKLAPELRRRQEFKDRLRKSAALPNSTQAAMPLLAGSESPLRRVARTGLFDTNRYASPSEARLAVLNHFVGSGWTLPQVENELTGQFSGLAALYGTPSKQDRLLPKEWGKATAYVQERDPRKQGTKHALISDTSLTKPTGGATNPSTAAIHQLVNDLENVLYAVLDHRLKVRGREGHSLRLLLRALLTYMRAKNTNVLDVGCRTLAVAVGKHHATVARLLPILAANSDGILTKTAEARYKAADVYLIQLPEHFQQLARELTWRKGKIHGVRPVFRALGDPAALAYEAIERGRHSPTTAEIIRATGISRSAVDNALAEMAGLDMIYRDGRQWKISAATSLTRLAVRLGVMDDVQAHISRNRKERAAWHAWLDRHQTPESIAAEDLYEAERDEYWLPPGEEGYPLWMVAA
jgi:hypothetical protein